MDEKSSSVDLLYTYSSESFLVGFVCLLKSLIYDWKMGKYISPFFCFLATSHLRNDACVNASCVNASCAHKVTNVNVNLHIRHEMKTAEKKMITTRIDAEFS